jgi:hypothetical protein
MRSPILIFAATSLSLISSVAFAIDYKFVRLVNQQTEVPGLPGVTFHTPRGGEFSDDRILLTGFYLSEQGYFVQSNDTLETVVRNGQVYPGVSFDSHFGGAKLTDSGVVFAYNHPGGGVFHNTKQGLVSIARIGESTPDGVFERFGPPTAYGDQIAFRARVMAPWGSPLDGVYMQTASGLTRVADSEYYNLNEPLSMENGKIVFHGSVPGSSRTAIYTSDGVSTTTLLEQAASPSPDQIRDFNSPQIRDGKVLFLAGWLHGPGGIFTLDHGAITNILKTGDPTPLGTFTGLFQPAFNGEAIALRAIYSGGAGLFSTHGGSLHSVIQDGDELFGIETGSVYVGRGALSDDGKIVFSYNLASGEEGVAMAIPVPEPRSVMLLAGWIAIFCWWQKRFG